MLRLSAKKKQGSVVFFGDGKEPPAKKKQGEGAKKKQRLHPRKKKKQKNKENGNKNSLNINLSCFPSFFLYKISISVYD
jgi:hypothetical protein